MQYINISYEAISCKDVNCKNKSHLVAINKLYGDVVNAMCNVGNDVFDKYVKVDNRCASKYRPGWTEYTDELHDVARPKKCVSKYSKKHTDSCGTMIRIAQK